MVVVNKSCPCRVIRSITHKKSRTCHAEILSKFFRTLSGFLQHANRLSSRMSGIDPIQERYFNIRMARAPYKIAKLNKVILYPDNPCLEILIFIFVIMTPQYIKIISGNIDNFWLQLRSLDLSVACDIFNSGSIFLSSLP